LTHTPLLLTADQH